MSNETKNILMIARNKKVEALRMATGLTLLDDIIRVAVIGDIDREDAEVELQLESLDFADVPVVDVDESNAGELAEMMVNSDVVFVV
jgi:Flp pilus assembly CpaE family ATPase